jgi:tRNA/tmRNA/rRNA uracil-C5-methylase (TrmA/RlmC/RlmD family)
MKKIFGILFLFFHLQSFSQKVTSIENVPVLEIANSTFTNILDSFVESVQKCCYYNTNWMFRINLVVNNDSTTTIHLMTGGKRTFWLPEEKNAYQALCFYKTHYFLITNKTNYFDTLLFFKTINTQEVVRIRYNKDLSFYDKKSKQYYIDPALSDNENELGTNYWVYTFEKGKFNQMIEINNCK